MYNNNLTEIEEKIKVQHEGDEKQLEVIFSDSSRLIVEAPAGYGKTTTMISRIAYLFVSGRIPNPKKILGLTFSVNAALKIKREVAGKLPLLIGAQNSPVVIGEKATITNYHGFCKGILKKYGYLLSPSLRKDVNLLRTLDDSDIEKQLELKKTVTPNELKQLKDVERIVKESCALDTQTMYTYNDIIVQKLLPLGYITHNAIIMFVLEIFMKYEEIKKFYQNFYALIIVDEFQDTNNIAWLLLDTIISAKTQLLFLGDPLQRIYGFIGALPNIMSKVVEKYNMTKIILSKNYRFRNNHEMLKLDMNIRANAATCFTPNISSENIAELPGFWGISQQNEAEQITTKVKDLMNDKTTKIAILFRGRGKNVDVVEDELLNKQIPYFYGMFTDEDVDYVKFHDLCQETFIQRFGNQKTISKRALYSFSDSIKNIYKIKRGKTVDSLLKLLDALVEKVNIDYSDLLPEDKYTLLLDIFENRQLKQAMEYVDSQVVISTVHGAKGLEWDYVILGDLEKWIFPGYYTCSKCPNKDIPPNKCHCTLPTILPTSFREVALDELSVFYVGITRAKKQVYVSASANRLDYYGNEKSSAFSCMAFMKGIHLVKAI